MNDRLILYYFSNTNCSTDPCNLNRLYNTKIKRSQLNTQHRYEIFHVQYGSVVKCVYCLFNKYIKFLQNYPLIVKENKKVVVVRSFTFIYLED